MLSLFYTVGLCLWFEPVWETNDDVAMAMVAHGYGFVSDGSPNLLFSNVIWGYIVRMLHGMSDLQGYSLGTLVALLLSGWSYLYFLRRLGVANSVSLPAVAAILAWPLLFPQFTINAGLLTTAAVLGWHTYSQTRDVHALVSGSILAVLGFLIRPLEFALVVAVATPFLPWRLLFRDRMLQIACVFTLLAVVSAHVIDSNAYRTDEWETFNLQNQARAPYTDFGIANNLKARPDILKSHGYSENDINLIANWFFVDPNLFNISALNEMVRALGQNFGPISISRMNLNSGAIALNQLFIPRLLSLTIAAATLLSLAFRPNLFAAWGLFLAALFGLGFVGANAHSRVIFAVLALLLLMSLALSSRDNKFQIKFISVIMLSVFVYNFYLLLPIASISASRVATAQRLIASFGKETTFVWGGALDFQATFPFKISPGEIKSYPPLFALGVMTYAPFSVAPVEERAGRGFLEQLRSVDGLRIIVNDDNVSLLRKYCEEHFNVTLQILDSLRKEPTYLRTLKCLK
ncbi:hypothetical protein [Mesorhizobium sp. A623]